MVKMGQCFRLDSFSIISMLETYYTTEIYRYGSYYDLLGAYYESIVEAIVDTKDIDLELGETVHVFKVTRECVYSK